MDVQWQAMIVGKEEDSSRKKTVLPLKASLPPKAKL